MIGTVVGLFFGANLKGGFGDIASEELARGKFISGNETISNLTC